MAARVSGIIGPLAKLKASLNRRGLLAVLEISSPEGEIKFFMDGDADCPTICGMGTEDYFGGAWCFGDTYWYQAEPHGAFPVMLGVKERFTR